MQPLPVNRHLESSTAYSARWVIGMQPLDPIFVRLVGRLWGKSMNRQVLWRVPVLEPLSHVNQDASHPGDTLDLGASLYRSSSVSAVVDLFSASGVIRFLPASVS